MAEPLKNSFGPEIPKRIADMIVRVHQDFPTKPFIRDALVGYEDLELVARGRQLAATLHKHLPDDFAVASRIVIDSLGPTLEEKPNPGMGAFLYMPHTLFVQLYGLDHFEESMEAQYQLTQRFTAEASIRPFIEKYPKKTLARLKKWTGDRSEHVRRLVSEGTRPRLPWASRLPQFQADPSPVIELLERLKDDPSLYVRRSVANNLNDIGKDNPDVLFDVARAWLKNASPEREWLVRHALRSSIKRGESGAFKVLGYGGASDVTVGEASMTPKRPKIGTSVRIEFDVSNRTSKPQAVLVDLRIHFIKSNGSTTPKVFKLKEIVLAPGETATLGKKISVAQQTTRTHFPGKHLVDAYINGSAYPIGEFVLRE